MGPTIVAVQFRRSPSLGKALIPGVGDIIRDMSSVWRRLETLAVFCAAMGGGVGVAVVMGAWFDVAMVVEVLARLILVIFYLIYV